jgi:peptide/nickel transport system permease protein
MLSYILMRILRMIPQLLLISVLAFVIIQLPPGDYLTEYLRNLERSGVEINQVMIDRYTSMYGLDKPMYMQYLIWIKNIVTKGDFGYSFAWSRPVRDVIGPRIGTTFSSHC